MKPLRGQQSLPLNKGKAVPCIVCGKPSERKGDGLYWCSSCACGFKAPKPPVRPVGGAA
jgi:hypothetical protein